MDQFILTITNWPVIVQGALGSALFAALFFIGRLISKSLHGLFKKVLYQRAKHTQSLHEVRTKVIKASTSERKIQWMALLIYLILGHIIRAFIWFIFGSITSSIIPVFSVIGYLGALYYLFNALTAYKSIDESFEDQKT